MVPARKELNIEALTSNSSLVLPPEIKNLEIVFPKSITLAQIIKLKLMVKAAITNFGISFL